MDPKGRPWKRNGQSELSIAVNLIVFKPLVSHGKPRGEQGEGSGVSRQRPEDKKTFAELDLGLTMEASR